ncbi:hypothetical protein ABEB36_003253 [Hypothenemus hampei]|uniref:Uncharacterized protein n=1 Tax=Hypothenemus hampei TaxID=57062 RepID=A0ABD1F8J2_HYPHA
MSTKSYWIHLIVISATLGIAKSASFVKAVVLAGLGLAGLWMIHTLAQDFTGIVQNGFGVGKQLLNTNNNGEQEQPDIKLFKRSINSNAEPVFIDWDMVIKRDPASCARSFICQLAASEEEDLIYEEKVILNLTRIAAVDDAHMFANKQLEEALNHGQLLKDYPKRCMKIYKFCPYTRKMMTFLIQIFGKK